MLTGINNLINSKKFGETSDLAIDRNGQISVSVSLEGDKSLCFRLVPTNDLYNMWSLECIRDEADRKNFNMKSSTFVLDYIKKELDTLEYKSSYVAKSLAKSKEPIDRTEADEEAPSKEELEAAITALEANLEKVRQDDNADEDEMEEWDAAKEYKNIVKTFPRDNPKIESGKTPEKRNVTQHSPKEQRVTLKEELKLNYDNELGMITSPASIPTALPRRNTIVPSNPRLDKMVMLMQRRAGLLGRV